jgi:Spy/CpxP family protein refolding chaperone
MRKPTTRSGALALLATFIVTLGMAGLNGKATAGEEKGKSKEPPVPGVFRFPGDKIKLTAEQQQAIGAIVKEYLQPVKELDKAIDGVYTKEQHEARKAARKKAHAEGKRGPEANEMVDNTVSLSADQKARLADLEAAKRKLHDEIRGKMAKLLTAEQKEAVGGPYKEKKSPPQGKKGDQKPKPKNGDAKGKKKDGDKKKTKQ